LKKLRVLHCDLKPENILFASDNKDETEIKIIDFGSSCFVGNQLYTYVQSRYYRAPEILLGLQHYDFQVDIWSLGCIIAEMYCGHPIFPAIDEIELFEF
jgi:dual specificity tyrosine-phosphorylation-regulated kinase 2/3/4